MKTYQALPKIYFLTLYYNDESKGMGGDTTYIVLLGYQEY